MECGSMLRYQVSAKPVVGQALVGDRAPTHGTASVETIVALGRREAIPTQRMIPYGFRQRCRKVSCRGNRQEIDSKDGMIFWREADA